MRTIEFGYGTMRTIGHRFLLLETALHSSKRVDAGVEILASTLSDVRTGESSQESLNLLLQLVPGVNYFEMTARAEHASSVPASREQENMLFLLLCFA
jgi:hypothetical protein